MPAALFFLAGAGAAAIGILKQRLAWFVTAAVVCLPMALYFLAVPARLFNLQGILLLGLPIAGIIAMRLGKPWLSKLVSGLFAVMCTVWLILVLADPW